MLPICKHNIPVVRCADYRVYRLQIGNIGLISDELENQNSHFFILHSEEFVRYLNAPLYLPDCF
jgi:hypothetical protein